ncbi:unnamed protein product [Peniophora sp. CBMAI 1063]|nr:unnamed protein product [Peniophora sp. CBMAI 1063]
MDDDRDDSLTSTAFERDMATIMFLIKSAPIPLDGPRELGDYLWTMYRGDPNRSDGLFLNKAIQATQFAVTIEDFEDPDEQAPLVFNLGDRLSARYAFVGALDDLNRAIAAFESAAELTSDGDPSQAKRLFRLGGSLLERCNRVDSLDDLHGATTALCCAAELMPDSDSDKSDVLNNYGISLRQRFAMLGDVVDLKHSIEVLRAAVRLTPDDDPRKPSKLSNFGNSLVTLSQHTQDPEIFREAISVHESAVALMPDDYRDKASLLHHLGNSFYARFEIAGSLDDLAQAVSWYRCAVESAQDGGLGVLSIYESLGRSFIVRYGRTKDPEDLSLAISTYSDAIGLMPDGHPQMVMLSHKLSNLLLMQFPHTGKSEDLDYAFSMHLSAVDEARPDDEAEASWQHKVGSAWFTRFESTGSVQDLDQAIPAYRRSAELTPDEHPIKASRYHALGIQYITRYKRIRKFDDLEQATSALRHAVQYSSKDGQDKPLDTLGRVFSLRFEHNKDINNIEEAISAFDRVVQLEACKDRHSPSSWSELGRMLQLRFEHTSDTESLERAITIHQRVIEFTPDGHSSKPSYLGNLGACLLMRFKHSRQSEDIEQAVSAHTIAAELLADIDPAKASSLNRLGDTLLMSFEHSKGSEALEQAVASYQRAVALTPDGHPNRALYLGDLRKSILIRFHHSDDLDDLERAIAVHRLQEGDLESRSQHDLLSRLNTLGVLLQTRFDRTGAPEDLEEAISTHQLATELLSDDDQNKPLLLHNLSRAMLDRFKRRGEVQDLEQAIALQRLAVELASDDRPDMPLLLNSLGSSLLERFRSSGELEDLEQSLSLLRRVNELAPDSHPKKASYSSHLGNSLLTRFEHSGDLLDLEQAIVAHRKAVQLTFDGDPDRAASFSNLGLSLHKRFEQTGDVEDLEKAISAHRQSAELTPADHPSKPSRLNNLGNALSSLSDRSKDPVDLEQAISAYGRAVNLTPDDHPRKLTRLINLCQELGRRFEIGHKMVDIEDAISAAYVALETASERSGPDLSVCYSILGVCFMQRFELTGSLDNIQTAITLLKRSLEMVADGDPRISAVQTNLGKAQHYLFNRTRLAADFEAAVESHLQATICTSGRPTMRFLSAKRCVMLLSENPSLTSVDALLSAHSRIITILPEIVWLGHDIRRRYEESSQIGELVNAAVAAAVSSGALTLAVEWLEAGRALIWAQVSSLRTPLDELYSVCPKLADSLRSIQEHLQMSANSDLTLGVERPGVAVALAVNPAAVDHRKLVIEHEKLLKEIRGCPGFSSFLLPLSFDQLMASHAHSDGPVVFINVDKRRCDALILHPDGAPTSVHLPDLSLKKTTTLARVWTSFFMDGIGRERGLAGPSFRKQGPSTLPMTVLERLWTWLVHPIFESLNLSTSVCESLNLSTSSRNKRLPHITWCPTGPLAYLPLHAAGLYRDPSGPRVFDVVASSYIPSLTALLRCANGLAQHTGQIPTMLLVTQPATPGQSPLPGTIAERDAISEALNQSSIQRVVLDDEQATVCSVQEAMPRHSWVHLSCHGLQEAMGDPTQSAFMLHDGRLSLSALMGTMSDNAELAFLSACQTAFGHLRNPEESAHLAAGMLAVGFKAVIGTTWSIVDDDAPVVVEAFYRKLTEIRSSGKQGKGETGAAYALNEATRVLRENIGESNFMRWIPFVHLGV